MTRALIVAAVAASALSSTLAVTSSPAKALTSSLDGDDAPIWKFAPVRGSCSTARTTVVDDDAGGDPVFVVGDLAAYDVVVCVDANRAGSVYVRADPQFAGDDHGNVVGTLAAGLCVRANGPLKRAGGPLGYAIPVEDDHGDQCRGYLSETVVTPSHTLFSRRAL